MPDKDSGQGTFKFGEFVLDDRRGALYRNGVETTLRPKCFEVLRVLVSRAGQLVTRDELLDAVWGGVVVTEASVAQCITEIRRALGDTRQVVIRTVPRRGFIFELPVAETGPIPAVNPSASRRQWVAVLAVLAMLVAGAWWALPQWGAQVAGPADVSVAALPENTIAVLRFADLSSTGDQAYFADGLAEEILHLLAQSENLRVVARTSSFSFAPGKADIPTVARELRVAYVLEGSVRREQDSLRVTSQLIDAATGFHVWSEVYDRKFEDIIRLQQEIATAVGAALDVALASTPRASTPAQAQAHELFLLGRHLFHKRQPGDLERAEQHLQRAVGLDPSNAAAWTTLAGVYSSRGIEELGDPRYRLDDQRRALERALQIRPSLAEAHLRLARCLFLAEDPAAARASLARAIELAPNEPAVLHARANWALAEGLFAEDLALRRQAVTINPLSAVYRANLGQSLLAAGELNDGLEQLYRARELGGQAKWSKDIAAALMLLGQDEDARRETAGMADGPERDKLVVLLGSMAESGEAFARLKADTSVWGRLRLAEVAAFRGDPDEALEHLWSVVSRLAQLDLSDSEFRVWQYLYTSALVGTLRSDARWPGLVARIGQILAVKGMAAESPDGAACAQAQISGSSMVSSICEPA